MFMPSSRGKLAGVGAATGAVEVTVLIPDLIVSAPPSLAALVIAPCGVAVPAPPAAMAVPPVETTNRPATAKINFNIRNPSVVTSLRLLLCYYLAVQLGLFPLSIQCASWTTFIARRHQSSTIPI